jgi:3-methyladenine DNA glycosylase/8-oxoguanine DNA glycosylase
VRLGGRSAWRATRTPDGPCCLELEVVDDEVHARAWGTGAVAVLDAVPALLGFDDTPERFRPRDPLLRELHRRRLGLRLGRTGAVVEALVPTVIGQRVTTIEAARSYRSLVHRFGEPAPGPAGLLLPPEPEQLAALPYWALHRCGIERSRAETIRRVASRASRLERAATRPIDEARQMLTSIPGIGPWSAAKVAAVALGDRDAVSVRDYNLPHLVAWALAGERRATDERMLELLAPYRPQRARAVRLLELSGRHPPRRAPHAALRSFASW